MNIVDEDKKQRVMITFRVPRQTSDMLDREAEKLNVNRSDILRDLVEKHLGIKTE